MGQKKEITNAIRQSLFEHKRIHLPSIGEITLLSESPYLDRSIGEITPSRSSLVFSDRWISPETKQSSLERISQKLDLDTEDSIAEVQKYSKRLKRNFGDQLNASRIEDYFDLDPTFGLPDLRIKRVPVIRQIESSIETIPTKTTDEVNELSLMRLASVIVAVFVLFGAMWWIWAQSFSPVMESHSITNPKLNVSPVKVKLKDADENSPGDSNAHEGVYPSIDLGDEDSINESISAVESEPDIIKESDLPEPIETQVNQADCTIIIGTFGDSANVARLKNDIKKMGYMVYEKQVNQFTRLGLSFNCGQTKASDLQQIIDRKYKVRSVLVQ